ncbi:MAG: RluA family pseudouridine synthase [Candidatus Omnitrophota bacterium]
MKKAFNIVFEDDFLIVVDKIAKILIQPSPKKEKNTLTLLLRREKNQKVFPCHRLDRETTGLIIYAKTQAIQEKIMEQFKIGEVKKKYIAFIQGRLKNKTGILEGYIIDKEGQKFGEKHKKAKTFYKVLRQADNFSVVELKPSTGRTNQLRIQFAKINNPILGEDRYAFRRDFKVKFKRLALHAYFLSFIHPSSGDRVDLNINLPEDMDRFLKQH